MDRSTRHTGSEVLPTRSPPDRRAKPIWGSLVGGGTPTLSDLSSPITSHKSTFPRKTPERRRRRQAADEGKEELTEGAAEGRRIGEPTLVRVGPHTGASAAIDDRQGPDVEVLVPFDGRRLSASGSINRYLQPAAATGSSRRSSRSRPWSGGSRPRSGRSRPRSGGIRRGSYVRKIRDIPERFMCPITVSGPSMHVCCAVRQVRLTARLLRRLRKCQ